MTEARGSERSDLDTGEAGDRRSDVPVDFAMEMMTAATPSAAETAGTTMFEPMERNQNGKRRRRSEAPATPSGLEEPHGENNATACAGANAAAPNCWTPNKLGASAGSPRRSTVVGNDDVDAIETPEVGCPPRGRQAVGDGHHKYDRAEHERCSTRPGSESERKRRDRGDGQRRA